MDSAFAEKTENHKKASFPELHKLFHSGFPFGKRAISPLVSFREFKNVVLLVNRVHCLIFSPETLESELELPLPERELSVPAFFRLTAEEDRAL